MKFVVLVISTFFYGKGMGQLEIVPTKELSDHCSGLGKSIVLYGELHEGKQRKSIHREIFEVFNNNSIDTVFIENSYSEYILVTIHNIKRFQNRSFVASNTSKILVPVDIEKRFDYTLMAIRAIYDRNHLRKMDFYNQNEKLYSDYSKTKPFRRDSILDYVNMLELKVLPLISAYKDEFANLIRMMKVTYTVFEPSKLRKACFSLKRDSIMAVEIENYIHKNNLKKWGGMFGSHHISLEKDKMFNEEVNFSNNLINILISKKIFSLDDKFMVRFIYDRLLSIYDFDSKLQTEYMFDLEGYYSYLRFNKKTIADYRDNTWFWVTKK